MIMLSLIAKHKNTMLLHDTPRKTSEGDLIVYAPARNFAFPQTFIMETKSRT